MEEIIKPVSKELLKAELTEDKRLRMTNKSNNQIYIITHQNAPNVMREIGRLREIAFRAAGGGTGLSMDIDEYDTMEHPYKQLIVWNPEAEEILGGYRYLLGTDVRFDEKGAPILATSHMFHFSDAFIKEYLPQTIELGRSFVTLEYQSTRAGSKGLFALDNLWDGLGALTVVMPNVKYFFGKVTMYPSYHRRGRDMIRRQTAPQRRGAHQHHAGPRRADIVLYTCCKYICAEKAQRRVVIRNYFADPIML